MRWRPGDDLLVELVTDPAGDTAALLVTPALPDGDGGSQFRHLRPHTPSPGSRCQVDTRGAITLPGAARALCGIDVSATVVLIAEPAANRLFVYPALLAARVLLAHLPARLPGPLSTLERRAPRPDDGHVRGAAMRPDPARIAIARDVLAHLGITLADLAEAEHTAAHAAEPPVLAAQTTPAARTGSIVGGPGALALPARFAMPTLGAFLPRVRAAAGPGANRTYGSYWTTMERLWGSRRLDQITATDIEALHQHAASTARSRRNSRHGRHAGEHVIAAARAIYTRASADGYLTAAASPAHRVAKPRRLPSTRRALTTDELDQINTAARTSGNDVILDALLLRLHTETACRRGGALALRLADLDLANSLIRLREKGGTLRWQPISPTLTSRLADHAAHRGALAPDDALLRYRNGRPGPPRVQWRLGCPAIDWFDRGLIFSGRCRWLQRGGVAPRSQPEGGAAPRERCRAGLAGLPGRSGCPGAAEVSGVKGEANGLVARQRDRAAALEAGGAAP